MVWNKIFYVTNVSRVRFEIYPWNVNNYYWNLFAISRQVLTKKNKLLIELIFGLEDQYLIIKLLYVTKNLRCMNVDNLVQGKGWDKEKPLSLKFWSVHVVKFIRYKL